MHEQSETIQDKNGNWTNVYGSGLLNSGQVLPIKHPHFERDWYETQQDAEQAAMIRSQLDYSLADEGMLSLEEAREQDRWIPQSNSDPIEFIQEPQVSIEEMPMFMEYSGEDIDPVEIEQSIYDKVWSEAEIKKSEEIAAAGKAYWDAVLQGAIEFLSGGGMLKSDDQNKQSDDKLIAEQQSETKTSTDVAKDLEEETTKKDTGGRRTPVKMENLRGEKAGWKMAEGSNFWSVDEKDPYWQTKRGYEEAMNLYGTKPGWVKEPSLEYNPKTGEYDSIEKEEFVDLKLTKRISL